MNWQQVRNSLAGRLKVGFLITIVAAGMLVGLAIPAQAETTSYLAFTSDVHDNTTDLRTWLESLVIDTPTMDYMIFGGDYVGPDMAVACSGTVDEIYNGTPSVLVKGNHDAGTYDTGLYTSNSDYAIYVLDSSSGSFSPTQINDLDGVLSGIDSSVPVFVLSHYPIHYYSLSNGTGNAAQLLEMLNQYSNVVFLWGHEHILSDPNIGTVITAGNTIRCTSTSSPVTINFTYANYGCMYNGPGGGAYGMLATLVNNGSDTQIDFQYKNLNGANRNEYTVTIPGGTAADLVSIAVTNPADKLVYQVGDRLDITGLEVTGTYSDDSTRIEDLTLDDIIGFDSSAVAVSQTLTITIGDQTTNYDISIDKADGPALTGVSSNNTTNTMSGMTEAMEFSTNGTTWELYTASPSNLPDLRGDLALSVRFAATDTHTAGPDTVFNFTVTPATLISIAITHPADKLVYKVGDPLDISGLEVTGTYNDDSTKVEAMSNSNISGFNSSATAVTQTLTVRVGSQITTYNISIRKADGLALTGVSSNNTTNTMSGMTEAMEFSTNGTTWLLYTASPTNLPDLSGTVTLRVRYAATATHTAGPATTFNFTAAEVTLSSIAITHPADKLEYQVGDNLSIRGLIVTGTYSDSSTKVEVIITSNISGFDSSATAVSQTLTITVGDQTTNYDISIDKADGPTLRGVTSDNSLNTIFGMTEAMEFSTDEIPWTAYDENTPNLPDLSGDLDLLVRMAATATHEAGPATTFAFSVKISGGGGGGGGGGGSAVVVPLAINTTSLTEGILDKAYSQVLSAVGGRSPYRWTASGLPAGVELSTSGFLSGFPEAAGSFQITIRLTDSQGESISHNYTLKINPEAVTNPVTEETPADPPGLTDVKGHWAEENIQQAMELGILSGYPDNTFRPNATVTRAEFVTMLVGAFKPTPQSFIAWADINNHWAREAILNAASNGLIKGYNAYTFGPDRLITREQMAVIIAKTLKLTPVDEEMSFADRERISAWARADVGAVVMGQFMNGYPDGTFRPQGSASRAEAITAILKALQK